MFKKRWWGQWIFFVKFFAAAYIHIKWNGSFLSGQKCFGSSDFTSGACFFFAGEGLTTY